MSVVKTVGNAIKEVAEPLNAGVSVFNGINSSIQAHKNRDAQREANYQNMQENQLNRDFNAQQADLQRQWSAQQTSIQNAFNAEQAEKAFQRSAKFEREMLEREAELNSPNNMLKQYQEAGFNPNLFGGQIPAASAGSASSPSAQGSNPSGASASVGSSIPFTPVSYSNPMFEAAQIANLNAQTKKLNSDTDLNKANRERLIELLSGEKALQHLDINQKKFNLEKLSPAEVNNLYAQTSSYLASAEKCDAERAKLYQEIENLKQAWNLTEEQVRRAKIENDYLPDILESEFRKNLAEVGVHEAHAYLLSKQATNVILEGGNLALEYEKGKALTPDDIRIGKADNEYTMFKTSMINNNKVPYFFFEQGKEIFGAIARGLGSAAGRIGAAVAASPK